MNQAREFKNSCGITGIVLTKLDGTARGGVVLAIKQELNLPVKFIGVGEQIDDFSPLMPLPLRTPFLTTSGTTHRRSRKIGSRKSWKPWIKRRKNGRKKSSCPRHCWKNLCRRNLFPRRA